MTVKILIIIIISTVIHLTLEYKNWNPNRMLFAIIGPKIMGDIIPLKSLGTTRRKVQHKIILYHNFFRSNVQPTASNMLRMRWHKGAAKSAQRWADACKLLVHDNVTGRYIDNYGACGQNIFIATHKVPWFFAVKTWWLEKDYFTFGKHNNLTIIGHYTQMVWAATHEVGCGISKCFHYVGNNTSHGKVFYNYVCNYCPVGNRPGRVSIPYRKGKPCGACGKQCRGKLCLNSCPAANLWSNCRQLYKAHPYWLCHTNTTRGLERMAFCKATCTCKRKIHD